VTEQREKFLSIYKESENTDSNEVGEDKFDPNNIKFKKGPNDEERDLELKMPGSNHGDRPII